MIKLKYTQLEIIKPLLHQRLVESKLDERCPVDYIFPIISLNMMGGVAWVFVDKEVDPSAILVLSFVQASVCNETAVIINLIYIDSNVRRENPRLAITLKDEMFETAEAFAASKGADVLQAASWVYRGCEDISPILKQKGFEPQTKEFVKILKPKPSP